MHKKLAADLTSLAHSILQMKNRDEVFALKKKAYEVYEKLSVLAYVEEYINNTPNPEYTKEELLEKVANVSEKEEEKTEEVNLVMDQKIEEIHEKPQEIEGVIKHNLETEDEEIVEVSSTIEEAEEEPEIKDEKLSKEVVKEIEEKVQDIIEEVESQVEEEVKDTVELVNENLFSETSKEEKKSITLDEELKDTIAVDVVADLFESATKKSLNDKLQGDIQIGLNDRIAFVKNLFDGSQEDFNRVVSQLNTLKTEKEAKKFINKMVKPDYNWTGKEEFEERFISIVERKFS